MLMLDRAGASRQPDPNTRDAVGHTPLHYPAMRYEQGRLVQHLLGAGADPNARADDGSTPLHYAAGYARNIAVFHLLERGADPNARNNANDTPLHYLAARWQATKDAGVAGLAIPAVVGTGLAATPSRTARATGLVMSRAAIASLGHDREKIHTGHLPRYVEAIELLIEHQASLFLGDYRGDMPIHVACAHGFAEPVEVLLDAGADPLIKDKAGRRALDLHLRKINFIPEHHEEALQRLEEATAKAIEAQTTGEGARTG